MENLTVMAGKHEPLFRADLCRWCEDAGTDRSSVPTLMCGFDIFPSDGSEWSWQATPLSGDVFSNVPAAIITGCETLSKDHTSALLEHLDDVCEEGMRVCLVYGTNTVDKRVKDVSEQWFVYDHLDTPDKGGPHSRVVRVGEWFRDHDAPLPRPVVKQIVSFCGEDTESLAGAMHSSVYDCDHAPHEAEDVLRFITGLGSARFWDLPASTLKGDREKVAELLIRQRDTISTQRGARAVLTMLENSLHNYAVGMGRDPRNKDDVAWVNAQTGKRNGFYVISEANRLGMDRLVKCSREVARAGQVVRTHVEEHPQTTISVCCTTVAQHVHLAHRGR